MTSIGVFIGAWYFLGASEDYEMIRAIQCSILVVAIASVTAGCDGGGGGGGSGDCTPTNAGVENCRDGLDNDCDGYTDFRDSECCEVSNGGIEICDGEDNDCNGQVDEGDVCSSETCTEGETLGCGVTPESGACVQTCVSGAYGACQPTGDGVEICGDEIDNDCDTDIDEFCECTPGEGRECGGSPGSDLCAETCQDNGQWSTCSAVAPNDGVEICDSLDNDCDGAIDNGDCDCDVEADPVPCGGTPEEGNCHQVCDAGTWSACQPVDGSPVEEICGDAIDNDCDGQIDEPEPCTRGACGEGVRRCVGNERGECLNEEWDCLPDEEVTEPCSGSDVGICDPGTHTRECNSNCSWGEWSSCSGVVTPEPNEICNGLDDDCDGSIDEDAVPGDLYGSNQSCSGAYDLGTDPDVVLYAYIEEGESSWFEFYGLDNFFRLFAETIEVDVIPPAGNDLDVYLYHDFCSTDPIAQSIELGSEPEHLVWTEQRGTDDETPSDEDSGIYYVQIQNYDGPSGCFEFTIDGLE